MDTKKYSLGIEFGSTRIKAVLIDENSNVIAAGAHDWENRFEDGIWTYSKESILEGLQLSYKALTKDTEKKYNIKIQTLRAIGISGMMHGYLAFDEKDNLLAPFRTWRNTITEDESRELSDLFQKNIPQRWTVAHFYRDIKENKDYIKRITFLTTLSGYIHYLLTGEKVLGIGDAVGMFPVDYKTRNYDTKSMNRFNDLLKTHGYETSFKKLLPHIRIAGEDAGRLTAEGAQLLDPTGTLKAGIPFCPPEGDAATGLVASNTSMPLTLNLSVGTSIFANLILNEEFASYYPFVDMVALPDGAPVAMIHCNNGASELNAWMNLFYEPIKSLCPNVTIDELYTVTLQKTLHSKEPFNGYLAYNYLSGEHITEFAEGRPLFVRKPDAELSFPNFIKAQIYAMFSTVALGLNKLNENENIRIEQCTAHGGVFKTPVVMQQFLASALNRPVSVSTTASEGGAYGMALLAAFMGKKAEYPKLASFLEEEVFSSTEFVTEVPDTKLHEEFQVFLKEFEKGFPIVHSVIENFL